MEYPLHVNLSRCVAGTHTGAARGAPGAPPASAVDRPCPSQCKRCRSAKDRSRLWKVGVRDLVRDICCALYHVGLSRVPGWPASRHFYDPCHGRSGEKVDRGLAVASKEPGEVTRASATRGDPKKRPTSPHRTLQCSTLRWCQRAAGLSAPRVAHRDSPWRPVHPARSPAAARSSRTMRVKARCGTLLCAAWPVTMPPHTASRCVAPSAKVCPESTPCAAMTRSVQG